MAKFLKPRRGSQANAIAQKIKLQKGELFMEFPNGYIGKEPGRLVIGDGATSYDHIDYGTTTTNVFQPFITDPSIYIPRFKDTSTSTGSGSINSGMAAINKMGTGSSASTVTLPTIVSAIKEALIYHGNSITKLGTDVGNKLDKSSTSAFVTAVTSGTSNGTIKITKNGSTSLVSVAGLKDAAYRPASDFAAYNHNHNDRYVTSIADGTSNGTIRMVKNGSTTAVSVYGLGSAAYTASTAYAASNHNHNNTYVKLDGSSVMTGTIQTTSVTCKGGNGDHANFDSSGNEMWRIFREAVTSNNLNPRYRCSNNSTAGNIFNGFLTISPYEVKILVKQWDCNFANALKPGQMGFFIFSYQGSFTVAGTAPMAFVKYYFSPSGDTSVNKYIPASSEYIWSINYNDSGTVVGTLKDSNGNNLSVTGIGFVYQQQ